MKIQSVKQIIERKIQNARYEKNQRLINKYLKINDRTIAYDSYDKIFEARETIANYAKKNDVSVQISDARRYLGEHDSGFMENYLSDKISIIVTNLKTKLSEERIIPVINDKSSQKHIYTTSKSVMLDIASEGLQKITNVKSHFEENFLRNLYRNISEMTKIVKE